MKLYMFRTVPLSIIGRFFTVHTAMVYVIQEFYAYGSVHHESILIVNQRDATERVEGQYRMK